MKPNKTLTKRAAAIKPDYAPLAAPPNPKAEEFRAAWNEYMNQAQVMPASEPRTIFTDEEHDAMMALALECAIDEQQRRDKEKQDQDAAKIAAALSIWPAIARHHLRVGVGLSLCDTHGMACERDGVVVYDTSEDDAAPHAGGTSDAQDAQKESER